MTFLKVGFVLLTIITIGMIVFLFVPLKLPNPLVLLDTEPTSSVGKDIYLFAFSDKYIIYSYPGWGRNIRVFATDTGKTVYYSYKYEVQGIRDDSALLMADGSDSNPGTILDLSTLAEEPSTDRASYEFAIPDKNNRDSQGNRYDKYIRKHNIVSLSGNKLLCVAEPVGGGAAGIFPIEAVDKINLLGKLKYYVKLAFILVFVLYMVLTHSYRVRIMTYHADGSVDIEERG